jgi:hypothetical protein
VPVVATPTCPFVVSRDQVRMFLRDYADARGNILLDTVEFTDRDLNLAIEMCVSAYNSVTPMTFLTPQSFPKNLMYVLLLGTTRFLLMSESFAQIRGQLTVQQGNISPVGISDKAMQYSQLAQSLREEWDALVRGVKTQFNMEGAYAVLDSGYLNTSRFNK